MLTPNMTLLPPLMARLFSKDCLMTQDSEILLDHWTKNDLSRQGCFGHLSLMDVLIWTWWLRALCAEVLITPLDMFVMGLISHCPPQLRSPWAASNLPEKAHRQVKRVHQSSYIILSGHPVACLSPRERALWKVFIWKTFKHIGSCFPPRLNACFCLASTCRNHFKQSEIHSWLVFYIWMLWLSVKRACL